MNWTDDQLEIIETRGHELLVSAAAGSGKTSVLVERIYRRITGDSDHTDIDRFVVVTFTKAAASEMKERLRKRMESALRDEALSDEQKANLRRQLRLLPGAHISTVHSFCNYVIGQYFHRIGIDPSLKQGSETELKLLKHEIAEQLLELEYEEESPDFVRLAGLFTLNKSDFKLENWILQIYEKTMSEPFPDMLVKRWEEILNLPVTDEKSPYIDELLHQLFQVAHGIFDRGDYMKETFNYLDEKKLRTITTLIDISKNLIEKESDYNDGTTDRNSVYNEVRLILLGMDFSKGLPKKSEKDPDVNAACRVVTPLREMLEEERDRFIIPVEALENERKKMSETCLTVLRLATRFGEMYASAKRERGIADFNDLEQFALKILYEKDDNGNYVPSAAASELAEGFDEIMIDEYQDSNRVQDTILWAVSGHLREMNSDSAIDTDDTDSEKERTAGEPVEPDNNPMYPWEQKSTNRFMVGDIKQSIYRFRNACPELFEQKLKEADTLEINEQNQTKPVNSQSATHKQNQNNPDSDHEIKSLRLTLSTNFRSAPIIIKGTNAVFRHIMHEDIGGVEYDKDAELNFGAKMPEDKPAGRVSDRIEIDELVYPDGLRNKTRAEATHIANRILEMTHGDDPIFIRDKDGYRQAEFRDIVILSRAVSPISGVYSEVFREKGIPFFTEQKEGFFGTREVSLMLEFLTVIDNPRQDIPLAGVLTGPMFDISEEELSRICIATNDRRRDLYERLLVISKKADQGETNELPDEPDNKNQIKTTEIKYELKPELILKIKEFLLLLNDFRDTAALSGVSSIIEMIYDKTGVYDYFAMQPDGERRCANLDYLLHMVTEFDKGSYQGVHAFIEYISRIISRSEDTGEPLSIGEADNVVRMMTIHKSKGLEFPVVIITRMDSEGNKSESSRFITDPELGLAGYMDDVEKGLYVVPVINEIIQRKNKKGNAGELFRLFYVAMTRAKDHLIMVREIQPEDAKTVCPDTGVTGRSGMLSFSSMIAPALYEDSAGEIFRINEIDYEKELNSYSDFVFHQADKSAETDSEVNAGNHETGVEKDANSHDNHTGENAGDHKTCDERNSASENSDEISYGELSPLPVKISVSDLKTESHDEENTVRLYQTKGSKNADLLPRFMRPDEPEKLSGAERGTIYHHVMANLDLAAFSELHEDFEELVHEKLAELVTSNHLNENELTVIDEEKIMDFISSDLGRRMSDAAKSGTLHREQPFIISKPADELDRYRDRGEKTPIMIQGIIDAYFEEDDGIVLMDYKTDRVDSLKYKKAGNADHTTDADKKMTPEGILIDRYRIQLELYRDALETVFEKPVKEIWIYSFAIGVIPVPDTHPQACCHKPE